jgi:heterotetrameric sarcosine oxidase delta subunit
MLIPCPYCGPRDHSEFTYLGDGTLKRPAYGADSPLETWIDYVYLRDNPRGPHVELWHHASGCHGWIRVRRDTLTHEVLGSAPAAGKL